VVKLPKDNACNLSLDASIYTHGDGGHIATLKEIYSDYTQINGDAEKSDCGFAGGD